MLSTQDMLWSRRVSDDPVSLALVTRLDTQQAEHIDRCRASGVADVPVQEGIELLRYDSVVEALT
jgi:hypothetical protein